MLHDGGSIRLRKLGDAYDPIRSRGGDGVISSRGAEAGEVVTGLLYLHADSADMHDALETVEAPLNALSDGELVPSTAALTQLNASLR